MKMRVQSFQCYLSLFPRRDCANLKPLSHSQGVNPLGSEILRIIGKHEESFVAIEFKDRFYLTPKQSKALHDFLSKNVPGLQSISILLDGSMLIVKAKGKDYGFFLANCRVSKWEDSSVEEVMLETPKKQLKETPGEEPPKEEIPKPQETPKQEDPPKEDPPTAKKDPSAKKGNRRKSMHVDSILALQEIAINDPLPLSAKSTDSQCTYLTVDDGEQE